MATCKKCSRETINSFCVCNECFLDQREGTRSTWGENNHYFPRVEADYNPDDEDLSDCY